MELRTIEYGMGARLVTLTAGRASRNGQLKLTFDGRWIRIRLNATTEKLLHPAGVLMTPMAPPESSH